MNSSWTCLYKPARKLVYRIFKELMICGHPWHLLMTIRNEHPKNSSVSPRTNTHALLHNLCCSLKSRLAVIGSHNEVTFSQYRRVSELIRACMQQKTCHKSKKEQSFFELLKAINFSAGWGNYWVTDIDQEALADEIIINLPDGGSHFC